MLLLLALSASALVSASAFQSHSILLQQSSNKHDVSSELLQRQSVLMAHPYGGYPPPPPPFADPYMMNMPYNNIYGPPPPPHMRGGPQIMRGPPPNYYQRPQDIMSEADAILNNIKEEEEWKTDRQKAKDKKGEFIEGEVINFNPEQSAGGRNRRPLKNAAAYPSDLDIDEEDESIGNEDGVEDSVFQGRMPGQPVNRNNISNNSQQQQQSQGSKVPTTPQNNNNMEEDPRAQHVILDEYDSYMNDFFDFPIGPGSQGSHQGMPPQSRGGPAVYTSEEEELIAAMGGRQRMPPPVVGGGPQPRQVNDINGNGQRTTQEFAGLGTLTNNKGRDRMGSGNGDPQQLNYNPEQNFNPQKGAQGGGIMPPPPPQGMPVIPPPGSNQASLREEGFLGDSTLKEISLDYSGKSAFALFSRKLQSSLFIFTNYDNAHLPVPIPYLADVLATWGVPIPINPNIPLGDMITGEQTFAILEAIHTLDIGQLHEMYSEDNIMNICDYYDIDIKVAFDYCMERGWALPFGVRTFLRVEQEEELLEVLG